ncbi:MAG: hypothetical protein B6244_11360 [Candidatus Cloacimonetes bacterium 4572_55]|nr:MAG: hypothetical protein B6244_11360 [Candidatus Cloacimonetes bacterium 4572_55]
MNLYEYQAKKIFSEYDIPIPFGRIAKNVEEAKSIAEEIGSSVVIKPQLGIKKRGKLGLILFADDPPTVGLEAERLFQMHVKGEPIKTLLIERKADIVEEFYLAVAIDYSKRSPLLIISRKGGVDIEKLAESDPDSILKLPVNILTGLTKDQLGQIVEFIGQDVAHIAETLYTIFRKYDAETVEINPIVRIKDNSLMAVDAVLNINDNSLFRHPETVELKKQRSDLDPIAEEAVEKSWTYIDLPGDIAILSSGAGLTMTILDLIHLAGGSAANFLDTAQIDEEGVYEAFKLLKKAKQANAILINIFAGLNRCDLLASGIVRFLKDNPTDAQIVIRMIGNKEESGHKILRDFGIEPYTHLEAAIERIVELSKSHPK